MALWMQFPTGYGPFKITSMKTAPDCGLRLLANVGTANTIFSRQVFRTMFGDKVG